MTKRLLLLPACFCVCFMLSAQNNVGIGTPAPDASSILELKSTTTGFLVPRLSSVERTAIAAPANALLVFDVDSGCFFYYASAQWVSLCKLSGPMGPAGVTGAQGAIGPTGIDGPTGVAGIAGVNGPTGTTGATGIAGVTGATGVTGAAGVAGTIGATGGQGVTGPTGPLGLAGGDLSGNYPNPTVAAIQGSPVSNAAPAANDILIWNGSSWTPASDTTLLYWRLGGNWGTTPGTNFVGTGDNKDFVIKTNSVEAMRVTAGSNVRIGIASYANQCGAANSAEDPNVRFAVVNGFSSFGSFNNDPAVIPSPPSTTWIDGVGALALGMNRSAGTSNVDFWNNTDPNQAAAQGVTNRGFNFRNFQTTGGNCIESLIMTVDEQGDLTLNQYSGAGGGANAYAFNTISDQRVKQNIESISEPVLTKVMKLNPVTYNYTRVDYEPGTKLKIGTDAFPQKEAGFLAQEVYQLFPEAVSKPKDEGKNLWAIDYSKLTVMLTKAMQEQQNMIQQQQAQIEQLKQAVQHLQEQK